MLGAGVRVRRAGEVITRAYVAYTGVGPTVVRLPVTETFVAPLAVPSDEPKNAVPSVPVGSKPPAKAPAPSLLDDVLVIPVQCLPPK